MELSNQPLVIIGVYSPYRRLKIELKESFFDELTDVIQKIDKNKEILLMGDFSGRVGMDIKIK